MGITEADLELARRRLELARQLEIRRRHDPSEWYEPSEPNKAGKGPFANQLGFHRAPHPIRLLVPGNGWGKTTAMAAEVHNWATHSNRWQKTPSWPLLMLWFVKLKDQFDVIRMQLETEVFGTAAVFKDSTYRWADGSRLWIGSADDQVGWKKWQGVPVDLVCFDEEPPQPLWREMTMRRRAKRKTRYVIAATATSGDSWMEKELYLPWLEHHQAQGLDEERALFTQNHGSIFVWSKGGIRDNPGADRSDEEWYDEQTRAMHPKERQVRLHGGFQSWIGDAVFDLDAIDWMEARARELDKSRGRGTVGMFEPAR